MLNRSTGQPVLIIGMHRSGTSLVAGAVARLLAVDLAPGPLPSNPHGQFERLDLRAHLDLLLLLRRSTWRRPPVVGHPPGWLSNLVARRAARRLGSGAQMWKDPRLAVTLDTWTQHLPTARIVLVIRHPHEVAESLRRRDGTSVSDGLELWESYNRAALGSLAGRTVFVVRHDEMLRVPGASVAELATWLGVDDADRLAAASASIVVEETTAQGETDRSSTTPESVCALWSTIAHWQGVHRIAAEDVPGRTPSSPPSATAIELIVSAGRTARRWSAHRRSMR